jgi:two-component system OmpR family sensor kinase
MKLRLAAPHSLRARLLWFVLAAILLTAIAQAVSAYRSALAQADEIFDYHMQQMAMALRVGVQARGPGAAENDVLDESDADFAVQVWTSDGLQVFQSTTRAALPEKAVLGFSNVQARGTTFRVFSMQSRSQVIQVAQDMAVRREMASTLALRTVAPIALMAPLLMIVVWWIVSASLAPVSRVRRQISERQADDLSAVSEAGLPAEVRPLVHELNLLFRRVHQAFDAQRNFVSDAAHELRSPLAALKLQAQGLQRATDDAGRELAVGRLMSGIDRATRLVEQLLVLARQQTRPGPRRPGPSSWRKSYDLSWPRPYRQPSCARSISRSGTPTRQRSRVMPMHCASWCAISWTMPFATRRMAAGWK